MSNKSEWKANSRIKQLCNCIFELNGLFNLFSCLLNMFNYFSLYWSFALFSNASRFYMKITYCVFCMFRVCMEKVETIVAKKHFSNNCKLLELLLEMFYCYKESNLRINHTEQTNFQKCVWVKLSYMSHFRWAG